MRTSGEGHEERVYRYDGSPTIELFRRSFSPDGYMHRLVLQEGRDGVVIVVTDGEMVLFQRQWREALQRNVWQFPRGNGESGSLSEPTADARRELREETGVTDAVFTELGNIFPDSGILSTSVAVVEARVQQIDLRILRNLDSGESIDSFTSLSLREIDSWITKNQLKDGITLAALQLWRAHHPRSIGPSEQ